MILRGAASAFVQVQQQAGIRILGEGGDEVKWFYFTNP
jgi:hypothetical protein